MGNMNKFGFEIIHSLDKFDCGFYHFTRKYKPRRYILSFGFDLQNISYVVKALRYCGFITSQQYRSLRGMIENSSCFVADAILYGFMFIKNPSDRIKQIEGQRGTLKRLGIYDKVKDSYFNIPEDWIESFNPKELLQYGYKVLELKICFSREIFSI